MSDIIFLSSIKDGYLSRTERRFMSIGGKMVWLGLTLLILSGIGITLQDMSGYLSSSKFLVKMFIVFIIFVNGIIFHFVHIPLLNTYNSRELKLKNMFLKGRKWIVISGSISIISWTATVLLGLLKTVPYSFLEILFAYLLFIVISILIGLYFEKKIIPDPLNK